MKLMKQVTIKSNISSEHSYILWRNSNESKLQTYFVRRFCPENNIVCCGILKTIIVLVSFFFTKEIFHHTIMYEYINNTCVNKSMRLQTFFTIIFMVSLVLSCKFTKTEGHRNPLISTCPGEGMLSIICTFLSDLTSSQSFKQTQKLNQHQRI